MIEMKIFLFSILFCYGFTRSRGQKCTDISGRWQNELGSRMLLKVGPLNSLSGEYYTAVVSNPGAAAFVSNIKGTYSNQGNVTLLAFSVLYNNGSSLTSWIGQCTVCDDGKEILHTSYIFRRYAPDPNNKWTSIMMNYNTFFRYTDEADDNELADHWVTTYSPITTSSVDSNKYTVSGGAMLSGKWIADNGEEIEIFETDGTVIHGEYQTFPVIGQKDGNDKFTAVALSSPAGEKIRSWTGHIYGAPSTTPRVLESAWMEHVYNPNCEAARDNVRIGVQNFTLQIAGNENVLNKPETFWNEIINFFS